MTALHSEQVGRRFTKASAKRVRFLKFSRAFGSGFYPEGVENTSTESRIFKWCVSPKSHPRKNGAIRLVPRIEKSAWTRSRVALRSAKVLFRRGPRHMRRTYIIRMGEKLVRIRQPDRNDDAARRVDLEKGRAPRLWSEFCSRGFPSSNPRCVRSSW